MPPLLRSTLLATTLALLLAPAAAAATAPTSAAPPTFPTDQRSLDTLGASLLRGVLDAIDARNAAKLEPLLDPAMQSITFRGAADRAGLLASMTPASGRPSKASDITTTRVGDALVVTGVVEGGPAALSDESPRLGVWHPTDTGWRLAAWASLDMPKERPAPSAPAFAADSTATGEGQTLLARFLDLLHRKQISAFDAMLAEGTQSVNFRGCQPRKNLIRGAESAETMQPAMADVRGTRCGDLVVVTCTLSLGEKIGWTALPSDPAPFLIVFEGAGDAAKVIAIANTNKPK